MPDLGLFNFIKAEMAKGSSRADITAKLLQTGNKQEAIDAAFVAIDSGVQPQPTTAKPSVATPAISQHERPMAVTVACFLLGVELVFSLVGSLLLLAIFGFIFGHGVANPASAFTVVGIGTLLLIVAQVGLFAVLYGYWMMRKWAVYLYATLFCISFVFSIGTYAASPEKLFSLSNIIAAIVIFIGFQYLGEMS